jgi:hypothetical protein
MGFTFKGLTTSALVSGNVHDANAANKDIADVPTSVQGHTSMDAKRPDENTGSPRSASQSDISSDEEMNKIDYSAEQGVQAVQAASHIWKKSHLIVAYVLYVFILPEYRYSQTLTNTPPAYGSLRSSWPTYPAPPACSGLTSPAISRNTR